MVVQKEGRRIIVAKKSKLMWIVAFLIVTSFDAWLYSPEVDNAGFWTKFFFSAGKYIVGAVGSYLICWWLTRESDES